MNREEARRAMEAPSGVRSGEGCPLSSRLGDLGERSELPQRGSGQSPGRKRILDYFWLIEHVWQSEKCAGYGPGLGQVGQRSWSRSPEA